MVFKVIVREDKLDGGFNVSCPALPGCHSQGDTLDEALEHIRDAIEGCLYVLNQRVRAGEEANLYNMEAAWVE